MTEPTNQQQVALDEAEQAIFDADERAYGLAPAHDGEPAPYNPTLDEVIALADRAVTDLRADREAEHSRDLARQQQAEREAAQLAGRGRELD